MESIEVSAKTVEDAVLEAAIRLGTTRDKVIYDVVTPGSPGFLGIGSKKAVIKARQKTDEEVEAALKADQEMEKILERVREKDEKESKAAAAKAEVKKEQPVKKEKPQVQAEKPKKSPAKEAKPAEKKQSPVKEEKEKAEPQKKPEKEVSSAPVKPVDTDEVKDFLEKVFAAMDMKVQISITQKPEDHELDIDLEGDDMGVLIGKRGQTLDSLQYLASLVVNKGSDDYIRVKVDTENYRERRKATLENLAKNPTDVWLLR